MSHVPLLPPPPHLVFGQNLFLRQIFVNIKQYWFLSDQYCSAPRENIMYITAKVHLCMQVPLSYSSTLYESGQWTPETVILLIVSSFYDHVTLTVHPIVLQLNVSELAYLFKFNRSSYYFHTRQTYIVPCSFQIGNLRYPTPEQKKKKPLGLLYYTSLLLQIKTISVDIKNRQ